MNKKQKNLAVRIVLTVVLMIALHFAKLQDWVRTVGYLVPYILISHEILRKAWKGILKRQVFDENFLMAAASLGAFALAIHGGGDYTEAVAVMLFYQVGELFESVALGRSRRSISDLMDIRPDYANIEREGTIEKVDPDEVQIGTVIVVRPGEKIPLDGVVVSGISSLDTAALTGESTPHDVKSGDEILSGCVNLTGELHVRTTKEFGESTASKILDLVENASSRKSRSEEFIGKFARWYTPLVCYAALALAILPPIVRLVLKLAPAWGDWIYRALTFLVISCPCALVVSVPLTFFAGLGGASRAGVLIKGSNFLETLSRVKYVVFDKTGTLTKGVFEIEAVHHSPLEKNKLLEYAAYAESSSSHPISLSLQRAYGEAIDRRRILDVQEYSGEGITARIDGLLVAVGNLRLMQRFSVEAIPCHSPGTIVHVALNGGYAGHIVINDCLKPGSRNAIELLRKHSVKKTVMLTGDRAKSAQPIASELGVDEFRAELLPADKVVAVEELLSACKKDEKLAFVGDGINDAPVLARADVGIAMGALGSDAAIEAADVVLMDDDPLKVVTALTVGQRCMRIVRQNICFALGVKALCLVAGALGFTNMWLAVFADVGVLILAVLNAIRALFIPNKI